MKNLLISCLILIAFSSKGWTQQHLSKTWSVSTGITFNAKGSNLAVHYHLNSFDELRFNFYSINQTYFPPSSESGLSLKSQNLSLEFSKGYKYQNLKKTTASFGIGLSLGKEQLEGTHRPITNLFSISTFQETEYAPLNWMALFTRFKMLIPTSLTRSKTLRLTFGTRFYF